MNDKVQAVVNECARKNSKYVVTSDIRRPFVTVSVLDTETTMRGVGFSCVQLPDIYSESKGLKAAMVRAVKDLLCMPSRVDQSEYLQQHGKGGRT